mmetsp:Transcript_30999/g.52386  ORF Transcript_30999/g.52386 Transcript_30999/m.52386 type:complete len:86 (+) Transcript_30999:79-336(+)|eukprot:CAMPEP_0174962984 /NCGR_PEP_ID=MMETSP0004_2-20121128/5072_1 /TAXON_ID=420556 /ORGANISM="Ochromonas sp., Strain CCMP1393" /LENGTH=85 /DNA_ID=CAMNT_0016211547 /DNA_START=63 /DNA_END=320 /DNA_ORIENTATION=+
MASGMGLKGNTGRCFHYFEDFAVCMKGSDAPLANCGGLRDDYLECLHDQKKSVRKQQIREQKIENEKILKSGGTIGGGGGGGGGH